MSSCMNQSGCVSVLRKISKPMGTSVLSFHQLLVFTIAMALGSWALCRTATAHDQIPGAPQKGPIAVVAGTVHPVSGGSIENGTVLFENGRITAVGEDVEIPAGAERIDASGMHVFPGMIDSMTNLGLREIGAVDVTVDTHETGDENPNVRAWVAVNPDSELIPVARANGVLAAMIVPSGSGIRGQSAVMALDGWTANEMMIRAPAGLCVNWERMEPREDDEKKRTDAREKRMKELDDLLDLAARYEAAREAAPHATPSNTRLESLLPVVHGQLPLIAEADRQAAIESAVAYAASRDLKLVIAGGYDADHCAAILNRYQVPVIITATYRLPRYRHDPYDASYTLPERLRKAGVKFAICGDAGNSSNARNLPYHAANAVAYGLPEEEALRSITLTPAEILGVADKIGSLEEGKLATLLIADGHILESDTQITAAFIEGRKVDLRSRHTMLYEKYKTKYDRQAEQSAAP